jgi:predicted RNA polymerase sigma factor
MFDQGTFLRLMSLNLEYDNLQVYDDLLEIFRPSVLVKINDAVSLEKKSGKVLDKTTVAKK